MRSLRSAGTEIRAPFVQMLGHSCSDHLLNHVTADGAPLCQSHCPLAACMEDGLPREAEVFLHHADGHRVPVLVRGASLRDPSGEIVGAVETFSGNAATWAARLAATIKSANQINGRVWLTAERPGGADI